MVLRLEVRAVGKSCFLSSYRTHGSRFSSFESLEKSGRSLTEVPLDMQPRNEGLEIRDLKSYYPGLRR